jgi:uncharacterized protein YegP (UPF0339 family)
MQPIVRRLALALAMLLAISAADVATAQKDKDKEKAGGPAVFEVYKDRGGEFRFRLKDADGTLLAIAGKGYDKKAECQAVIDAIKKEAAKAKVEDETTK